MSFLDSLLSKAFSGAPKPNTQENPFKAVSEAPQAMVIPTRRKARPSGISEPANISTQLDVQRIQSALRAAERGEWWMLVAIYRDMILGYSHLQAEWGKRKQAIVGQK